MGQKSITTRRAVVATAVIAAIAFAGGVTLASTRSGNGGDGPNAAASSTTTAPATAADISLATTSPAGNIVMPTMPAELATGMLMVGGACTATPTAAQQQAAVDLVNQTVATAKKYASLDAAKAAGFIPITPAGAPIVHYVNAANLAKATPATVLDPNAPQALVYVNTRNGPELAAVMYLMPGRSTAPPPAPGGCLTRWHLHTNLCFDSTRHVVGSTAKTGACPAASAEATTQPMMHVWLAPVPGGPLSMDPAGADVVRAAYSLPAVNPPAERA